MGQSRSSTCSCTNQPPAHRTASQSGFVCGTRLSTTPRHTSPPHVGLLSYFFSQEKKKKKSLCCCSSAVIFMAQRARCQSFPRLSAELLPPRSAFEGAGCGGRRRLSWQAQTADMARPGAMCFMTPTHWLLLCCSLFAATPITPADLAPNTRAAAIPANSSSNCFLQQYLHF